jgi:2-methylcitrate dehydratase PrpD
VRVENIPAEVLRLAKKTLLDCMGLALAGAQSQGSVIVRRHIKEMGRTSGGATVFGTNLSLPAPWAALANGAAMHADDFDDSYHPAAFTRRRR